MNFLWLDWHNIHTVHVSLLQKVLEQRAEVFTMKVYKATIHDHPVCICDGFKQIIKIQRQEWIHCLWLRICLLSFLGKESCQSWIYAKHTSKFASMRPQKSWWPITHRRDVQVHTASFWGVICPRHIPASDGRGPAGSAKCGGLLGWDMAYSNLKNSMWNYWLKSWAGFRQPGCAFVSSNAQLMCPQSPIWTIWLMRKAPYSPWESPNRALWTFSFRCIQPSWDLTLGCCCIIASSCPNCLPS